MNLRLVLNNKFVLKKFFLNSIFVQLTFKTRSLIYNSLKF